MRMTFPRWLSAPALVIAFASCSDATEPSVATTIVTTPSTLAFSALGQVAVVSATVRDQNGALMPGAAVSWSSSDADVTSITADGVVTAVGNGSATLTASSGSTSAEVVATVAQVAALLEVTPDSVVLKDPGDTAQMTVTVLDALGVPVAGPSVNWSSADDAVVMVDGSGLVTAVGTGTAVITASVDGSLGTVSARVEPEVTLMAAGPTSLSGEVASLISLAVRVEDLLGSGYAGTTVSWSTAAGSGTIASGGATESDPTGHAGAVWQLGTGAGVQQATASIESRGNLIEVTFDALASAGPAVSASLVTDSIFMHGRGETAFLGPTYLDQFGNVTGAGGILYESRDPAVAMVAPDGLVTAVDAGATYVDLTMDGSSDSLRVIVDLRGAITVTFDDGFREVASKAFPVMEAMGLKGNVAVNPAQVGFPAYIAKDSLDVMDAAGWSMVSHAMTHDTLTTLTAGELDWELRASQEWIDAQGYRGSNVFIVPFLIWDARERDAIGTYYEAARGTSATALAPDTVLVPWRPSQPFELTGIEAEELPYTSAAGRDALRDLLQRTVDEGAFVDVFFHHLPDGTETDFQLTMQVIEEFKERVLPYHELYPRFARSVF